MGVVLPGSLLTASPASTLWLQFAGRPLYHPDRGRCTNWSYSASPLLPPLLLLLVDWRQQLRLWSAWVSAGLESLGGGFPSTVPGRSDKLPIQSPFTGVSYLLSWLFALERRLGAGSQPGAGGRLCIFWVCYLLDRPLVAPCIFSNVGLRGGRPERVDCKLRKGSACGS
jgi:hypothetical protein